MSNASTHEPPPKEGQRPVAEVVLRDLQERIQMGESKYGMKLKTFNGRNALWDAYQECLDMALYLRQAIMEQEHEQGI
jgi:hypothetical protein